MEFPIKFETEEALEEFPDSDDSVEPADEMEAMDVDEPVWKEDQGQWVDWLPPFTKIPGPKPEIVAKIKSPFDAFKLFFSLSLVQDILLWSNAEGKRRAKSFQEMSMGELLKVFGIQIVMGINRFKNEIDHWSTRRFLGNKWIKEIMARNR